VLLDSQVKIAKRAGKQGKKIFLSGNYVNRDGYDGETHDQMGKIQWIPLAIFSGMG